MASCLKEIARLAAALLTGSHLRDLTSRTESPIFRAVERSPIAQSVEQMTVNHWVAGSSPARGAKQKTKPIKHLA